MRLVTFEDPVGRKRAGALTPDGHTVDLNTAFALSLREQGEGAWQRIADARVPPDMRQLFEGGDRALDAARAALEYAGKQGPGSRGASGEPLFYAATEIKLKAPIKPLKFFHTAGNFREHHEEAVKAGFSHPVMPWIVFFQNVDAIIGHEEPVIHPAHLTREVDYELELAVVMKKSGKHFTPEQAGEYVGGYVIFQ